MSVRAISHALAVPLALAGAVSCGRSSAPPAESRAGQFIDVTHAPGTTAQVALKTGVPNVDRAATASLVAVTVDRSTFLFDHPSAALTNLTSGSTVFFGGLGVRRIVSLQRAGNLLVIATRPAPLEDAIRDGVLKWDYPIDFGRVAPSLVQARVVRPFTIPGLIVPVYAAADQPITIRHAGDKDGWHYETTAIVNKDRLSLDALVKRQDAGAMEIEVRAKGELENFRTTANIEIQKGAVTRFEYANQGLRGTMDFEWTARKGDKGVGTLEASKQLVTLPPFAELPLDVGGFPFTLDIRAMFLVQPAFTSALEATHGRFKTRFHGDLGFRVDNGVTTRIGRIEDDGEITDDVKSSSPYAPMGFVAATALPRIELKQGFTPSSLQADNGPLADRVRQLLAQNGMKSGFDSASQPADGGSYAELITSTGLTDSGHLSFFNCQQTSLLVSAQVGGAAALGAPGAADNNEKLGEYHRLKPPIKACEPAAASTGGPPASTSSAAAAKVNACDPNATGDASYFDGVPGGSVMRGFHGVSGDKHQGVDVMKLRDAPVFVNLRAMIPLSELSQVLTVGKADSCTSGQACPDVNRNGLGLAGTGDATLVDATVVVQPWSPTSDPAKPPGDGYGGIVGFAAHYQYTDNAGKPQTFTAYVEYEHLITATYLPRRDNGDFVDNENQKIDAGAYTGCKGFGASIAAGTMTPDQLARHPLIGYLGSTQNPHVHVQAAFSPGKTGYLATRFFDPAVLLAH